MELRYSKDEILTIYLNRAYLGAGARGFEAAAQRYFGKSAAEVEPAEAAMLAGCWWRRRAMRPPTTSTARRARRDRAQADGGGGLSLTSRGGAAARQPGDLSEAAERARAAISPTG
jgi:penicillin-binding protein 1A